MSSAGPTERASTPMESETVFGSTPSTIVALVLLVGLSVVAFGAILVTRVRRYRRSTQAQHSREQHVSARRVKEAYFQPEGAEVPGTRKRSASCSARLADWFSGSSSREPELELPWPVYAVMPHLRPKAPLHVRMLRGMGFWRGEEVKREPLTVADVKRAKEEHEYRTRGAAAIGHKEGLERTGGWWSQLTGCKRSVEVPDIVIHPCDGSPAFSFFNEFVPPPILLHHAPDKVQDLPPSPPSPVVDADPDFSPASTASEPDSPMPVTPTTDSATFPVVFVDNVPFDSFEAPMPSSTAPKEAEGKDPVVVNLSNFSREAFSLRSPPDSRPGSCGIGLGLEFDDSTQPRHNAVLTTSSSTSSASSSSTTSVPDILSVLEDINLDSSLSAKLPFAASLTTREASYVSGSYRRQFAGILDLIKHKSSCSDSGPAGLDTLPGSRSTYYGILHDYDGGDVDSGTNGD